MVEGDLEADVRAALARHKVDPALLELELTENTLMSSAEHTIGVLSNLKALGIKIAIDDFGTGYSSLAYLKRFPIDKLKIDIVFVRDITVNPDDAAIALAIISMAHSMKMTVLAEGVESRAQLAYLRRHRRDEIQGFHFSRPLPAREMAAMLAFKRALPGTSESAEAGRQTLLRVDSDATARASLHRLFRRDNYRVLTAMSPAQGFDMLALHRVHVILCEQRLPIMSGTEFLSKMKKLYPDTIRIILSGHTGLESVIDSINRGAIYRFYTKPWDDTELRDNIRLAFHHYWGATAPRTNGAAPASRSRALTPCARISAHWGPLGEMVEALETERQGRAVMPDQAQSWLGIDASDLGHAGAASLARGDDGVTAACGCGKAQFIVVAAGRREPPA